jgi:hypothetical protein
MAGRPSKYKPEFAALAKNYCLLGAKDDDLERFFEVSQRTIQSWKNDHPDFADALRAGKDIADSLVARSLYDKAVGGDTTACIFWLKNRQKHAWRDRHEIDHSGKVAVDPIQLLLSQVEGTTLKPK